MGERIPGERMPGRLHNPRVGDSELMMRSKPNDDDDQYYMDRMREILNGFPNTGPPTYPVQILDHLYMGNQRNADNVELLRRYGITHVLNCAGLRRFDFSRSPYPKDTGIKGFLMISAEDTEDFDIARHFDEAIAFLDGVKKVKGKALVHCNLGVNRSGAVVAAYLMVEQRRTLLEVTNYLKVKRFVVLSNKGFRRQLIQFARSRGLLDPVIRYSFEDDYQRSLCHQTRDRYSGKDERRNREDVVDLQREREGRTRGGGSGGENRGFSGGDGEKSQNEHMAEMGRMRGLNIGRGGVGENMNEKGGGGGRQLSVNSSESKRDTQKMDSLKSINDKANFVQRQKDLKQNDTKNNDSSSSGSKKDLSNTELTIRDRLWTLPRYMGRGGNGRNAEEPAKVEVIVSEHKETVPAEKSSSSSVTVDKMDAKSRSKTPLRQLDPVYETRSCDAVTGSGSATGTGTPRLTTAESMSAKLTGFLNLLGPKKPLRSTSYSNVSSSQSSSSVSTLSPSPSDERPSSSSSSSSPASAPHTSASVSSLSTSRPLRVYTRSCTDSEIYRTRQGDTSTAGRLGRFSKPSSKS